MECVYDADGDRRRKGATDKERKTDTLDTLVCRLRTAPENEVGTIVDQLRTSAAGTHAGESGTRLEKPKSSSEYSTFDSDRTAVQDTGKLQVDEHGDVRHFGHSSSLESIHTWPRRIGLPPSEYNASGPIWTSVTSDNNLISELLVSYPIGEARPLSLVSPPTNHLHRLYTLPGIILCTSFSPSHASSQI